MVKVDFYKEGGVKVNFVEKKKDEDNTPDQGVMKNLFFDGSFGKISYVADGEGGVNYLVGLGKLDEFTLIDLRTLGYKLAKELKQNKVTEATVEMPDLGFCQRKTSMAFVEGVMNIDYHFTKKTEEKKDYDLTLHYVPDHGPEEKHLEGLKRVQDQLEGVFFARDLVNETSNIIFPETLADRARDTLETVGVEVTILDKDQIHDLHMDAFLSVAKGSDNDPRFIIMEYKGDPDSDEVTGLVGKGLTYDSGGYCIKPGQSMATMHSDMGGAGTVIGTMLALAKAEAKVNVTAVVAACENLVSGHAFKTGDIIGSMSGKTIEVLNTDAEGRLTLADALYYITSEKKVDRVIDLATLTGAALVALGEEYTAAVTNNNDFYMEFQEACDVAGEKVWLMPNDKKFAKMNKKTKVADLLNSPGRMAGTVTAGLFVGEFLADENTPWLHLDIAGTAFLSKANDYLPERATGVHVKALYNLLNPLDAC